MFGLTRGRWQRLAMAGLAVACVLVVAIAVLAGASPYRILGTGDPGLAVRLAAPLHRLAVDALAAVCVGSLAFVVFFTAARDGGEVSPAGYAALRTAGRAAAGWAVAALVALPLDAASAAGLPLTRVLAPTALVRLTGALEGPKAWLLVTAAAGLVALGCRATLRWRGATGLLFLALFAVLPPLATGHSASDAGHDLATGAIMLHVLAAVLWLGLLLAVVRARGRVGDPGAVLRRYRRVALGCWAVLAYSGIVDAAVLVPRGSPATTGYVLLVGAKVAALCLVGLAGVWARRRATGSSATRPGSAGRLLAVELAVLTATFGVSAALTHLPPPAFVGRVATGDETLLGYGLAAAPNLARLALDWRVETLFAPVCAALAAGYLLGVRRLRRAGRAWPAGHTACWLAGCAVLLVATSSGVGRYAAAMFSVQMAAHMLIGMLAPILFALGGPLTLAGEALRPALPTGEAPPTGEALPPAPPLPPAAWPGRDGGPAGGLPGPRDWLAALRTSSLLRTATHPLVCTGAFVAAPFLLYFTGAVDLVVRFHWAHAAADAAFLAIGYLFAWPVLGVDPPPRPLPHLLRVGLLLAAMPADIVFGAAVAGSRRVLGDGRASGNMYSALDLPWVPSLPADQRLGAYLALGLGEVAFLVALVALVARWQRTEVADAGGDGYARLVAALAERRGPAPAAAGPAAGPTPPAAASAPPPSAVEAAQPQAVGHHQQGRHGHGGAGDERVE